MRALIRREERPSGSLNPWPSTISPVGNSRRKARSTHLGEWLNLERRCGDHLPFVPPSGL